MSPDIKRREAVEAKLQSLEDECTKWVNKHMPGGFSSIPKSQAPTAALLLTEQVKPLSEEARSVEAFEGLELNRDFNTWESEEWPAVRLTIPSSYEKVRNSLVFACRRDEAFPDEPGYPGSESNSTIAQRANRNVHGILSRWSITCLLKSYHQELSRLRDSVAQDRNYRPIRDLKELRSLARTMLYDIGACAPEIIDFTEANIRYQNGVLEMTYVRDIQGGKPALLDNFKSAQKERAQQVQREASLLQTMLSTSNDLSQTITNIRIQRFLLALTVLSICIAAFALM